MVNCFNAIFFKATNELRGFASTTHNNENSLFAALRWFVLGAARLVVFRLVGFGDTIASRDVEMAACCWTCEGSIQGHRVVLCVW